MPYPIPENSGLYIEILSPLSFCRHVSIAWNITFCTLINSRRSNRSMKDVSQSKDIRFINISFAGNIYKNSHRRNSINIHGRGHVMSRRNASAGGLAGVGRYAGRWKTCGVAATVTVRRREDGTGETCLRMSKIKMGRSVSLNNISP